MFKQDGDSNEKLYGRKLAPEDILFKGVVPVPAAAGPLHTALTRFSPHGGEMFHPK
jgi:lipid-binding SYLF domain-containing protein